MTKEELITYLSSVARDHGGRPPGESRFLTDTRLSRTDLWNAGIRSYGDLCELAGFPRNRLKVRYQRDQLFEPLAQLTLRLGRFPNHVDREFAHHQDKSFPSYEAFRTAAEGAAELARQLLEWCQGNAKYSDAAVILQEHSPGKRPERVRRSGKKVNGYVYLLRYGNSGRDYKVGMSEDVSRRHAQIAAVSPSDVRVVHVIETDDPAGIERYWLRRFEDRRLPKKKEIFRLTADDIAAFKARKYQ